MVKGLKNNMDFPRFELISQYKEHDELMPRRATWDSAGYDFIVAEDTIIPAYFKPESGGFDYLNIIFLVKCIYSFKCVLLYL